MFSSLDNPQQGLIPVPYEHSSLLQSTSRGFSPEPSGDWSLQPNEALTLESEVRRRIAN